MPISGFIFAGPPVDDHDIDAVEQQLGFALPAEYRKFLLWTNGGRPEPEDMFPFGPDEPEGSLMSEFFYVKGGDPYDAITRQREVFEGRVPPDLLAVGCDAGGSLVCVGIEGKRRGKVYFWSMDDEKEWSRWGPRYGNVWEIADNFDEFLAGFSVGPKQELTEEERRWNNIK